MADDAPPSRRVKSSWELALERLDSTGIGRPRDEAFDAETLAAMDQARQKASAKLAEMEILQRKSLASTQDPEERQQLERDYRAERARVEERREREIEALRGG
jgi:hypothetical protein